jgi:hypothetical protein
MNGGVSLTITPLLALGADQDEKISLKAMPSSAETVVSVQLDKLSWSQAEQEALVKMHAQEVSLSWHWFIMS